MNDINECVKKLLIDVFSDFKAVSQESVCQCDVAGSPNTDTWNIRNSYSTH